jgi:hypothetical protein
MAPSETSPTVDPYAPAEDNLRKRVLGHRNDEHLVGAAEAKAALPKLVRDEALDRA